MLPTLMRGSEKCKLNVLLFSDLNFAKVLIDRLNMLMFLSVQVMQTRDTVEAAVILI